MRILQWVTIAGGIASLLSCSSDTTHPTATIAADQVYWSLSLNHHAITLAPAAPYDTVTLTATSYTATHTILSAKGVTIFSSSDPGAVTVNSDGLLTALQGGQGIVIVAKTTIGALSLADTAYVNVNVVPLPPPILASVSIHPLPGDSSHIGADQNGVVTPYVVDMKGDTLSNVAVYFRSSDTTTLTVDQSGNTFGVKPGHVTLYAEATAYGVSKKDSVQYTVTQPFLSVVTVDQRTPINSTKPESFFTPGTTQVAIGGYVAWLNQSGQSVDVVFDDAANVDSIADVWVPIFQIFYGLGTLKNPNVGGNIPTFTAMDSTSGKDGVGARIRYFPKAGTYNFHSTLYNTTGKIVVANQ